MKKVRIHEPKGKRQPKQSFGEGMRRIWRFVFLVLGLVLFFPTTIQAISISGDFDGDGQADTAVYEESTGNWFVVGSTAGFFSLASNFGGPGFIPVPGDYDGDNTTDAAVYELATGNWFVIGSTAGFFSPALGLGGIGFSPVPADHDGDGVTDAAVYDEATGNWFVIGSTAGFFSPALNFGGSGFTTVIDPVSTGLPDVRGKYTGSAGSASLVQADCADPDNDGSFNYSSFLNISTQMGASFSGTATLTGVNTVNITLTGTVTPEGQLSGTFTFTNSDGASGNGTYTGLFANGTVTINFSAQITSMETCIIAGSATVSL